jgi:hypothetical protein
MSGVPGYQETVTPGLISGVYLGTDKVLVKVYLDFFHQIVEQRTDNNLGTKQFGPG